MATRAPTRVASCQRSFASCELRRGEPLAGRGTEAAMQAGMSQRAAYQKRMEENLDGWIRRRDALLAKRGPRLASGPEGWRTAERGGLAKLAELRAASGDE